MKPIILDMSEMSDSTEVYSSRPSPILSAVVYCLCALLVVSLIWMNFFKMDEVVCSSGMVKSNNATATISVASSGEIVNYAMEDDTYVEKGTVLFELDVTEVEMKRNSVSKTLEDLENKVQILEAYIDELDGVEGALFLQQENPYYKEYVNRYELMQSNCASIGVETEGLRNQYLTNIQNITSAIQSSKEEEEKLVKMVTAIESHSNTFAKTDIYYYSTVNSYINAYNTTAASYDSEIQKLKDSSGNVNDYTQEIANLEQKKENALLLQEQEMVASIEQSILSIRSSITDMSANKEQAQSELDSINNGAGNLSIEQIMRNERATADNELTAYKSQLEESTYSLNCLDYTMGQAKVVAQCSGYLNLYGENVLGDYVQAGTELGTIVPVGDGVYKIQIYVDNQDIGKIKENATVKFEIAAYPSSEYGQATGVITKISEDLKINQDTGKGYYLAEATIILPENCDAIELKQGMAVEAKVVVGEKTIMKFLLEKLDLIWE